MKAVCDQQDDDQFPAATHADKIANFFQLSGALSLDQAEEQALLDLSEEDMASLRLSAADKLQLGDPKLERRLNYAIPILQRMLAAVSS